MITGKPLKPRRCRQCERQYSPFNSFQVTCGNIQCAMAEGRKRANKARAKTLKAERKVRKEKLVALQPRRYWMKKAQVAVNAYVRARDRGLPCISCGRPDDGAKRDAGHFRSTSAAPNLRLMAKQINAQCVRCNQTLSGNQLLYRVGLIAKIGLAEVERIENDNEPKKYTIEQLQAVENHFKQLTKGLI